MRIFHTSLYEVAEISLCSARQNDLFVDVIFCDPAGHKRRVPAFVTNSEWRARYSSSVQGVHSFQAVSSNGSSSDYGHGIIEISANSDTRGPLRVSSNNRYLEHADGTPFLWLADTWWFGFTDRISDDEFSKLASDRVQQGFSVVQIVAGLYPEIEPFSPEGCSVKGWPWFDGFSGVNSDWFDAADKRVIALVKRNIVPCIVGAWAHYLDKMTETQMLRHWRELIARWGALPVVWCLFGEPPSPLSDDTRKRLLARYNRTRTRNRVDHSDSIFGLSETALNTARILFEETETKISRLLRKLNLVVNEVKHIEPYGRPIIIHSQAGQYPWLSLENESSVDFWLQQTGHLGPDILIQSVQCIRSSIKHVPTKPVINGEPCYEGICGTHWQDTQRFLFWSSILSGAAGHTYGAHGLWGFNTSKVSGFFSGRAPQWRDAAKYVGASHVGIGRKILLGLPWHKFKVHSEWVEPHSNDDNLCLPYAAGIENGVRVIYIPSQALTNWLSEIKLCKLGISSWSVQIIDPRDGKSESSFTIVPESDGTSIIYCGRVHDPIPSWEDWIVIVRPEYG